MSTCSVATLGPTAATVASVPICHICAVSERLSWSGEQLTEERLFISVFDLNHSLLVYLWHTQLVLLPPL